MLTFKTGFMDSEYAYWDEDGWHLKEGAPADVQKEFDEYMSMSSGSITLPDFLTKKSI